jgi:hypothetical protein
VLSFETRLPFEGKISFGGIWNNSEIDLSGIYGPDVLSGAAGRETYTLVWSKSAKRIGHDYWTYVQLLTQDYQRLAGSSDEPVLRWLYPSTQWVDGDQVPVRYLLDVPELIPGAYRLVAGVYPPFGESLPAYRDTGEEVGGAPTIAWIKVAQPEIPEPGETAVVVDATVDNKFRLLAVESTRLSESQVQINLYWESLAMRPNVDATVFVHVLDADANMIAQSDVRPWNGQYPTFIWDAGEVVKTEHVVNVGSDVSAVTLRAGMYTFPGPQNLPVVQDGVENAEGLIQIQDFAITE